MPVSFQRGVSVSRSLALSLSRSLALAHSALQPPFPTSYGRVSRIPSRCDALTPPRSLYRFWLYTICIRTRRRCISHTRARPSVTVRARLQVYTRVRVSAQGWLDTGRNTCT
jgi:hypothetical protein